MENITELVRRRRSVRTFNGKEVNEDDRKKLALFMGFHVCRIWRKLLDILLRGSCYMHNLLGLARFGLAALWTIPLLSV